MQCICQNCGLTFKSTYSVNGHKRVCKLKRLVCEDFNTDANFEESTSEVVEFGSASLEDYNEPSPPRLYSTESLDASQRRYLNFQKQQSDVTSILSLKAGHNKQFTSPERVEGDMYHYLEIANFVETTGLSSNEGTKLIDLVKWVTYDLGNEASLPATYKYLGSALKKKLRAR